VKAGDLVKSNKGNNIGIVVDVFGDLNPGDPWVHVLFTHAAQVYQWCKMSSLTVVQKKEGDQIDPLLPGAIGGSGSL
jgi:rRNA processing protein Gar1